MQRRHIEIEVVEQMPAAVRLRITKQTHRKEQFGGDGTHTVWFPDVRLRFMSCGGPEWRPEENILYVRGDCASSDDVTFDCSLEDAIRILEAVKLYNDQFRSDKLAATKVPTLTIDSVVMAPDHKLKLRAALAQHTNYDLIFNTWGLGDTIEKGRATALLFYGTPGTGKTLMAQAISEELGLTLKVLQSAELESSIPGQMERNTQKAFKEAEKLHEVLLFDECDSLIYDRNDVGMILAAQINCILSCLEQHIGVVIFTTNRLQVMDPAFERRLALKLEFPFPDSEMRMMIWKRLIPAKMPCDSLDFNKLAKVPLAGGNIKNCVLGAARRAAYLKLPQVTEACFIEAIRDELAGQQEWQRARDTMPRAPGMRGTSMAMAQRSMGRETVLTNGSANQHG